MKDFQKGKYVHRNKINHFLQKVLIRKIYESNRAVFPYFWLNELRCKHRKDMPAQKQNQTEDVKKRKKRERGRK